MSTDLKIQEEHETTCFFLVLFFHVTSNRGRPQCLLVPVNGQQVLRTVGYLVIEVGHGGLGKVALRLVKVLPLCHTDIGITFL